MLSSFKSRLLAALLVSSVGVAVTGCAGETAEGQDPDVRVGSVIQPIIKGAASGTEHDSVVILTTVAEGQRAALCTATLVAPNLIVTARHCVSNVDSTTACTQDGTPVSGSMVQSNRAAASFAIFVGQNGVAPDSAVESNAAARGKFVIVDASKTVCNHDVAFVVLDRNLSAPVSPIRMGGPTAGEKVAAVGWGINETGNLVSARSVRKDIPLIGSGPAPYPDNAAWGYGESEFMTGESTCAGDSGGPAFAPSGALVGISARAGNGAARDPNNMASTCVGANAHAVYTHLAKFEKLINFAYDKAGQPIWKEGQPNPWATATAPAPGQSSSGAISGTSGGSVPANPDGTPATTASDKHSSTTETMSGAAPGDPSAAVPAANAGDSGGCSMSQQAPQRHAGYGAVLVAAALALGVRRRRGRTN